MSTFSNIKTIARYEIKILLRSWFFRIFSGLAFIFLFFYNLGVIGLNNSPWFFRAIPASIPYVSILLLNVLQAVIAVFLASDFLKRDKKLDTTEVIYMRSMSNLDYVFGKTLGVLFVFLVLNAIISLMVLVFNLINTDIPVRLITYLYYPVFISLPTLVFIFGLAFLLMVLIRNQAITFILLLGYIALTLFYLGEKLDHLFDYMAFSVPFMYSDITRFGNISDILVHRGIYFMLGIAFVFTTILLLKRLSQSPLSRKVSLIVSVVSFAFAAFLGSKYISNINSGNQLRQEMIELDNQYVEEPRVWVTHCNIELSHEGNSIKSKTELALQNNTNQVVENYIFSLNPGLIVEDVSKDGKALKFERRQHLLIIPEQKLDTSKTDKITITYSGTINEEACYLDINDTTRNQLNHVMMFNIDKRHAFLTSDYVLLTHEVLWYPEPGVTHSPDKPEYSSRDFTYFTLNVTTKSGLTAISQGKAETTAPGKFTFKTKKPIPQMALLIGKYQKRSIVVDSVQCNLVYFDDHDYFSETFNEISDTIPAIIQDAKEDFERKINRTYPYSQFSLIEIPIQFYTYPHIGSLVQETSQPEMVFLPEKGMFLDRADFSNEMRRMKERNERDNNELLPKEAQAEIFSNFIRSTIFSTESTTRRIMRNFLSSTNEYSIFPNYYSFVNNMKSDDWPILNSVMESYIAASLESSGRGGPMFFLSGLSDDEKANLALQENSLQEMMALSKDKNLLFNTLNSKGTYLMKLLQYKTGDDVFESFIYGILDEYKFKQLHINSFNTLLKDSFNFDLMPFLTDWYKSKNIPGYIIQGVKSYKVTDGDRTRYQVRFKISNPEEIEGLLSVTFRTGGSGGGPGGFGPPPGGGGDDDDDVEKIIYLQAKQTKEFGILLDNEPREMIVNTLVSQNLPASLTFHFESVKADEKAVPFEGEKILEQELKLCEANEIVVDNEDPGFKITQSVNESFLKKILNISDNNKDKYQPLTFWRIPSKWALTTGSDYFGKYIRSVHFTAAGTGDSKVAWTTEIKEAGNYDVYYYSNRFRMRGGPPGSGRNNNQDIKLKFMVYSDDGVEEVVFDTKEANGEWNFLGNYYISPGSAKVEMTNDTDGKLVVADAIKWVRQ